MRVSTAQFYVQSGLQMSGKSSDINEQMAHLTSGKRVLSAKDDAVQYGTLAGFNEDLTHIAKYKRNITMAENHNSLQDIVFADAELLLDNIKQDMLLANNGRMSSEDLQTLANQVRSRFDQLLDLANSQNANGDYIFSGYKTAQKPFSQQVDGRVVYSGDSGVSQLQIAKNIEVATNQTGDAAFLKVPNAVGDFTAVYPSAPTVNTSGVAVESANVVDRNTYNTSAGPYTFSTDINNNLTVTDSTPATVFPLLPAVPAPYVAGQVIAFDGIEVTLSGNTLPGESFTLAAEEEISLFDTINEAISWMEQGPVSSVQEQHQVDYNTTLNQLNSAMKHITSRRVDAGIRLQVLENQENRHLDIELNATSGKASIEDLDFAKAISDFEQSKVALQASQQAFSKVQSLTLFNYL